MSILKKGKLRQNPTVKQLRDELENGSRFVKFSMNIPRPLHREFKKKCALAEIEMKDILMQAIQKYLLT